MELESDLSLTLSSIHPEKSSETHERFNLEKLLINQDMVRWNKHSVVLASLVEGVIAYTSITP